jgi:glycerol-3-phosphate dehydrogenase
MHIAVIGAGISGLGCAHQLVQRGHRVEILEAPDLSSTTTVITPI